MGKERALYRSAFAKGEAVGRAKSEAAIEVRLHAEIIVTRLIVWLGALDPALLERIRAITDRPTLYAWQLEAIYLSDAEGARLLAEKIQKAPLP
jgi:hypothetical protein